MPSSKTERSIFPFYSISSYSILVCSKSYLKYCWSKPSTSISRPTNGQCSQFEKDLGINLGNAWCCGSPSPRWGYFLCYTSSVFEMGPSLTSEKPVEGALPRKGHVAQLMRGSCRPPGFEKGACSCPGEKFSRVVRERGFSGYAHPLGTQEHYWGMSLSSRLPRFPQSACHICSFPGNQPAAFLCPNLPHTHISAQTPFSVFLSLLRSKTCCLLICHIFLQTFLTNPQYQPHPHPQDWNRYFISSQDCLLKKIIEFPNYNTCCCRLVTKSSPTPCEPMDYARQAPLSMGFSRQEHWSGLPFPPPGDLPDPEIKPSTLAWQAHQGSP